MDCQQVKEQGKETGEGDPSSLRKKQILRLAGAGSLIALAVLGVYASVIRDSSNKGEWDGSNASKDKKSVERQVSEINTPLTPVDSREIWVSRVEKKAEGARQEVGQMREESRFLEKRIDVIEDLLNKTTPSATVNAEKAPSEGEGSPSEETVPPSQNFSNNGGTPQHPQHFPVTGMDSGSSLGTPSGGAPSGAYPESYPGSSPPKKRGSKIFHLASGRSTTPFKSPDLYLPAGTYCKAVVDMGVAVSTATNSESNPEPIRLRLVDNGNLPGGLRGQVKDAVLIGACYGDISSERARCRLEILSWRDKQGATIEKKIEGWIVGEDGIAGLRGKIVDRSGEIAREAFGAGLLSAAANFLKFEATSSVYPMGGLGGGFGGQSPMGTKEALQGGLGSGVSNALDKLAEFSIKRAEQMSPIVFVSSGRIVDILLKSGVDLTPDSEDTLQVIGGANPDSNTYQPHQEN